MKQLFSLLPECRNRDRFSLQQRLRRLQQQTTPEQLDLLRADIAKSQAWVIERRARIPTIHFPEELPVSQEQERIQATIAANQVIVLAGETGSGKTTQLPKMLLAMGYGASGVIGHTQPRRLAARSVAARIQEELGSSAQAIVSYKIRFQDQSSDQTSVKLMTDGILLAELQHDPFLSDYEVIIIDEAHERSLNIDFLLGVLHKLLAKRPDLKLIITSATIETERFSAHFNNAPVIEVTGRTYPVTVRYQPISEDGEQDLHQGVIDATESLVREGPGDILVFLSGEREIRDLANSLNEAFNSTAANLEIVPLYARLSAQEQNRVFQPHGERRIVLATNVAETSLTVPRIRYVIDTGLARISRYSYRTKVQRLPVEPISQASANQRAGRCGRLGPGICIRLYAEDDFLNRPEFTDPEILRTNLASVILQMASLKLGDIRRFPFLQRPDERFINDGMKLLEELQALEPQRGRSRKQLTLTPLGRKLGRLPIDPRLGAMVLASEHLHCAREVLVIVAALSIQDPRERPHDKQQRSDELHKRFSVTSSDFLSYLKLWEYLQTIQKEGSASQFRKRCKKEFIHYLRVREWQDVYTQLRHSVRELGIPLSDEPGAEDHIHQAMLTGLLSQIGTRDEKHEYMGARQTRFFIFPGSGVFKAKPKWLMAAELVETSRLYARYVAEIKPEWVEQVGAHLLRKSYNEPRYSKRQGAVVATEQVTLFGLLIVAGRRVQYGRIDPIVSRELFIRQALVAGEINKAPQFVAVNQQLIDTIQDLEAKSRRRDILVDEEALYAAYERVLDESIVDDRSLNYWWRKATAAQQQQLIFQRDDLMAQSAEHVTDELYPDEWQQGSLRLPLDYVFEPSQADDGVNIDIPLVALSQVQDVDFDWQVPALRHELVTAWIRSLPKRWRRNFVPAPDYAQALLDAMTPFKEPLREAMSRELRRMSGLTVPPDAWDETLVSDHLRINFRVRDESNKIVQQGRSLSKLQQRMKDQVQEIITETAGDEVEQAGLTDWSFGDLPKPVERRQGRFAIKAYPALADEGKTAAIRVFDQAEEAERAHKKGLRRLVYLQITSPLKYLQQALPAKSKLAMYFNPWGRVEALIDDCVMAAIDQLIAGWPVNSEDDFRALVNHVRAELNDSTLSIVEQVERCLLLSHDINKGLKGKIDLRLVQSYNDIKHHLSTLIYPGFVTGLGVARLTNLERYLKAIDYRLDKLPVDPNKDRLRVLQVEKIEAQWQALCKQIPEYKEQPEQLSAFRWHIEEFRVSLFAQVLGTAFPVSEQRLQRQLAEVKKSLGL